MKKSPLNDVKWPLNHRWITVKNLRQKHPMCLPRRRRSDVAKHITMIRNCAAEQNLEGVARFGDEILNGGVENGGFWDSKRPKKNILENRFWRVSSGFFEFIKGVLRDLTNWFNWHRWDIMRYERKPGIEANQKCCRRNWARIGLVKPWNVGL